MASVTPWSSMFVFSACPKRGKESGMRMLALDRKKFDYVERSGFAVVHVINCGAEVLTGLKTRELGKELFQS
jgi:hypothetical protein